LVPFPLPEALRPVARAHQTLLDPRLLQTAAAALHALPLDPTYLGGQLGMVGGLHPWPRELASHPPVHSLVPGGALSPDGSPWRTPRSAEWLVPVQALSSLVRGTCKAALRNAGGCAPVPPQVWPQGWVTPGQPAGTGTAVLTACAPSLSRMAIPTNRLETLADGPVTCRVKERTRHAWTHRTLPGEACILPHVLPKGCPTVRSSGVLRPRRRPALPQLRPLVAACPSADQGVTSGPPRARHQTAPAQEGALHCRTGAGPLVFLCRLWPQKSRPPSCVRAVPCLTGVRPLGADARHGVRDPAGTA